MPEIIRGIDQDTIEWMSLRLASVGSTAINKIAPGKDGYDSMLYILAGEYLSHTKAEPTKFKYADRGHIYEPAAREEYKIIKDVDVEQIAMVKGDKPHTHTSTDGLVGTSGVLEIKTRTPAEWLKLAEGKLYPIADRRQCQWDLHIYQNVWVDYVNYCPELHKAGKRYILIDRITRDNGMIGTLETAADKFIKAMLELAAKYKAKRSNS